jgi:DNA-binding response OmpR family regulator
MTVRSEISGLQLRLAMLFAGASDDRDHDEHLASRPVPVLATVGIASEAEAWIDSITPHLENEGFRVVVDPTGSFETVQEPSQGVPRIDLAMVDMDLPDGSGPTLCAAWRRRSDAPILAVSRWHRETTALVALAAGADQYTRTSVTPRLLVARIRALLRRCPGPARPEPPPPSPLFALSAEDGSITYCGVPVTLSRSEQLVLADLVSRPGRVVTRAELLCHLPPGSASERSLDFVVRRLRDKLEGIDARRRILTVRGVGFRFEDDDGGM